MTGGGDERRENVILRELVQELLNHVRHIARRSRNMAADELEYAQERLEWLADEVWRALLQAEGDDDEGEPPRE